MYKTFEVPEFEIEVSSNDCWNYLESDVVGYDDRNRVMNSNNDQFVYDSS